MTPRLEKACRDYGVKPNDPLWVALEEIIERCQPLTPTQFSTLYSGLCHTVAAAIAKAEEGCAASRDRLRGTVRACTVLLSCAVLLAAVVVVRG